MKLAVVLPSEPRPACGVTDHTECLAYALKRSGYDVEVFFGTDLHATKMKLKSFNPGHILLQYTPYLYDPSGGLRNGTLPFWLRSLRNELKTKITLLAHEAHYPIEASLAGVSKGLPQAAFFMALLAVCDQTVFTYETIREKFAKISPHLAPNLHWLPVGSNIPVTVHSELKRNQKTLLHFGGAHPTHLGKFVIDAWKASLMKFGEGSVKLVLVGATNFQNLGKNAGVEIKGYLGTADVSHCIQEADLILAPFLDGISTRRGSAMAAFAHGKAVVSTKGTLTNPSVNWDHFCVATDVNNPAQFSAEVIALLEDQNRRENLGKEALRHYQSNFDWPVVAARLMSLISNLR